MTLVQHHTRNLCRFQLSGRETNSNLLQSLPSRPKLAHPQFITSLFKPGRPVPVSSTHGYVLFGIGNPLYPTHRFINTLIEQSRLLYTPVLEDTGQLLKHRTLELRLQHARIPGHKPTPARASLAIRRVLVIIGHWQGTAIYRSLMSEVGVERGDEIQGRGNDAAIG
ncbi:hypothetical protein IAQ61_007392 [Plenodomus lingam]|uniref:uncharacterized protein n=1 Tax=Leptosphaeria maculans TaxID=5022 RepID=UPI003319B357|nr:hypothetical protein IAQ61_007392 [Plenodomus lingam]